jgi:hypothetical protein
MYILKKRPELFFLLIITVFLYSQASAQDPTNDYYSKVTASSPTASSLGKYGDVPVSYHTGVPDISIPLYTIHEGPLKLPVTLNYHASGLKVSELASWVGAGWSLNAGGVITRTIRGQPDERGTRSQFQKRGYFSDYGIYSYPESIANDPNSPYGRDFYYIGFEDSFFMDGEPDLFFFNFNGYSGKFYFRDDRVPIIVPDQDIKIDYDYTGNTVQSRVEGIRGFILTTPDGIRYYFGKKPGELTNEQVEISRNEPIEDPNTGSSNVISSWFLYKMETPDKQFSINLSYDHENYGFHQLNLTEVLGGSYNNGDGTEYSLMKTYMQGIRLKNITTSNGTVDFIPGALRQDLSSYAITGDVYGDNANTEAKTLGSVSIKDAALKELKRFDFSYGYFTDASPLTGRLLTIYGNSITSDQNRLKLTGINEVSANGSQLPPYSFGYFTEAVPRRLSFGSDFWGFINGANNSQLIPTYSIAGTAYPGANRDAAWPAMRGGTLNKITYPTGGYVLLDYQANTFVVNSANALVGGLRVYKITKHDGFSPDNVTTYDYAASDPSQSSGILYSKPTVIQILRNDLHAKLLTPSFDPGGCFVSPESPGKGYVISPTSIRPMNTTQGYHIGYSQVKVSQTGNGSSVYRYYGDLPYNVSHDDVATRSLVSTSVCDPAYPSWPEPPPAFDYVRGTLKYEGQFNNNGIEVKRIDYYTPDFEQNKVSSPALIVLHPKGSSGTWAITHYNIYSSRKTHQQVDETVFDLMGANGITTTTNMWYGSAYHHQLTKKTVTNSKNEVITTNYVYAPDFRVAAADAINDGYITYTSAIANAGIANSSNTINCNSCTANTLACLNCKVYVYNNYICDLAVARRNYLTALKNISSVVNIASSTPSLYTTTFNSAKTNADALLKPILEMQNQNILQPVEATSWRGSNLTGAKFTLFDFAASPANALYAKTVQTIYQFAPGSTYTAPSTSSNGTSIVKDSRYLNYSQNKFNNGNLIETSMVNGSVKSYIWDYNNNFPVAITDNATSDQVAYTSFEANGNGNWTYGNTSLNITAPTGNRVYNFAYGAIGKSNVTIGKSYIVSYYSNSGPYTFSNLSTNSIATGLAANGWTYYEHKVTFTATIFSISGVGLIDELRFYPADALMNSYTYVPLNGVSTVTDTKGATMYYTYDSFQRVDHIKDYLGNIKKSYDYNYAGQILRLTRVPSAAMDNVYFRSGCPGNSTTGVHYSIPSGLFFGATQQEADAKALEYLNIVGQENANLYGVCAPVTYYTYILSANQGFSATYQYVDDADIPRSIHLDVGASTSVCAQNNSVTGGPFTKGAQCFAP